MTSISRFARRSLRPLALTVLLGSALVGCSQDTVAPTAPVIPAGDAAAEVVLDRSGTYELPTGPDQPLPAPGFVNPLRFGFQMENRPGAQAPVWAHFSAEGRFLRAYPSLEAALEALRSIPAARGRHVGVGIDFTSQPQSVSVLDQLIEIHETRLGNFEIQRLLSSFMIDPSGLTDFERRYVEAHLLPSIALYEDLQLVRDAAAEGAPLARSLWTILRIFVETLVSAEDNRFDDHDGDGIPNTRDDDYDGVVWKNGPITVSGGGDDTTITIGGCFDPCPAGIPVPGC